MSIDPNLDNEVSFITGVTSGGQIAGQSFWAWNGDTPATYSGGHAMKWGGGSVGTAGGVVTYGFDPGSNWTATEQNAFAAAFALWSEVANIQFVQSPTAAGAEIDITRSSADTGSEGGMTYTPAGPGGGVGTGVSAVVDIATSVPGFGPVGASFSDYGGYPYLTVLHEIGHAIGLGHAGPYDANVTTNSQDEQAQLGPYDLQAYSVMSYIASGDTSAAYSGQESLQWNYGSSSGNNGGRYANVPITPQIADILAVQRLYGLPTSTPLSGGQTFGFGCNIQGPTESFFDFHQNPTPVVTLWDSGANNTLDLSGFFTPSTINLNQGAFSSCAGLTNNIGIAYGTEIDTAVGSFGPTTFYANNGNDLLEGLDQPLGGSGSNIFYAGTGADVMIGGAGKAIFYGSSGTDTYLGVNTYNGAGGANDLVVLAGAAKDYYLLGQEILSGFPGQDPSVNQNGFDFDVLLARNGSGTQYISTSIAQVEFADGSYAANTPGGYAAAGVTSTGSASGDTLVAPSSGVFTFNGGSGADKVVLNGNVGDYTLGRSQLPTSSTTASQDAFTLTATNGSGIYTIDENISAVQFQNGQYLSSKDLPSYVHGSATVLTGGTGNDLLYQSVSVHYELFVGGAGHDDLYLNGNTRDYSLQAFTAVTAQDASGLGGQTYSGLELVANNGSGAILIDSSVETIHFQNGQYLAYGDLSAYVAANASPSVTYDIALDGDGGALVYQGAGAASRALLNGNVSDYSLSRDAAGDFVLDTHTTTGGTENTLVIAETVSSVQFADGQYLALQDLGAYVHGSDVFTQGTNANDILFTPSSGDSYVVGGNGVDNLYLTGNTRDYTIQAVNVAATSSHAAVNGYELVADNGSGNVYIDDTVETVHFQDGQYLAFHDLTAYVDPFHG